jgi:hypothetical protein
MCSFLAVGDGLGEWRAGRDCIGRTAGEVLLSSNHLAKVAMARCERESYVADGCRELCSGEEVHTHE